VGEAERRGSKRRSGEKEKRKGKEEETEKRKNSGSKEVAEEWEIWDEEEEAVKSEAEAKKLMPEKFHRWIKVFRKK